MKHKKKIKTSNSLKKLLDTIPSTKTILTNKDIKKIAKEAAERFKASKCKCCKCSRY